MKLHRIPEIIRGATAVVGGFALFTGTLQAAPFLYSSGDLVLAIRQTGNANDLVVNIGKATDYSTLPEGTTLTVANLASSQLATAFPSVNGISWSAAAAIRSVGVAGFPFQTLWVTAPRADAETQSAPWLRFGQYVQGNAGSQIDAIGNNAAAYSSSQSSNANNTAVGVVIPTSSDYRVSPVLGDSANYAGTFQGNVENTTPGDFDLDPSNVSRSDLYELIPGASADGTLNTPGRYLGYFELSPGGTLTFNAATKALTAPAIKAIWRNGEITTIAFTTVANATYRLRSTTAGLSLPLTSWETGASVSGNGALATLQETNSAATRFYVIEALR